MNSSSPISTGRWSTGSALWSYRERRERRGSRLLLTQTDASCAVFPTASAPSLSPVTSGREALMNALLLVPVPSGGHKTSLRRQEIWGNTTHKPKFLINKEP